MPDTVNRDSRLGLLLRLVESITASPDLPEVLSRVADVARDLAECHDLDTVLERIARGANTLCAADVGRVWPCATRTALSRPGMSSEHAATPIGVFAPCRALALEDTPSSAAGPGGLLSVSHGPRCRRRTPRRSTPKASAALSPSPSSSDSLLS